MQRLPPPYDRLYRARRAVRALGRDIAAEGQTLAGRPGSASGWIALAPDGAQVPDGAWIDVTDVAALLDGDDAIAVLDGPDSPGPSPAAMARVRSLPATAPPSPLAALLAVADAAYTEAAEAGPLHGPAHALAEAHLEAARRALRDAGILPASEAVDALGEVLAHAAKVLGLRARDRALAGGLRAGLGLQVRSVRRAEDAAAARWLAAARDCAPNPMRIP